MYVPMTRMKYLSLPTEPLFAGPLPSGIKYTNLHDSRGEFSVPLTSSAVYSENEPNGSVAFVRQLQSAALFDLTCSSVDVFHVAKAFAS